MGTAEKQGTAGITPAKGADHEHSGILHQTKEQNRAQPADTPDNVVK
jgi:hypothetical protein